MSSTNSFLLFGDSITQFSFNVSSSDGPGWGSLLSEYYSRKVDIVNRGLSGYNTRWALSVIKQLYPTSSTIRSSPHCQRTRLVTVFFGANDASLPNESSARQHVPIDEYEKNLGEIIDYIRKNIGNGSQEPHVVVFTPPPLVESKWVATLKSRYPETNPTTSNRSNVVAHEYGQVAIKVAKEKNAFYVDLWTEMSKSKDWEEYLEDGLHLSQKGNQFLFDQLQNLIEHSIKDCSVQELVMEFPDYKEIDIHDLDRSLVKRLHKY